MLTNILKLNDKPLSFADEMSSALDQTSEQAVSVKKEPVQISTVGTFRKGLKEVGRNDPCPCGSGKKYKKCCGRSN